MFPGLRITAVATLTMSAALFTRRSRAGWLDELDDIRDDALASPEGEVAHAMADVPPMGDSETSPLADLEAYLPPAAWSPFTRASGTSAVRAADEPEDHSYDIEPLPDLEPEPATPAAPTPPVAAAVAPPVEDPAPFAAPVVPHAELPPPPPPIAPPVEAAMAAEAPAAPAAPELPPPPPPPASAAAPSPAAGPLAFEPPAADLSMLPPPPPAPPVDRSAAAPVDDEPEPVPAPAVVQPSPHPVRPQEMWHPQVVVAPVPLTEERLDPADVLATDDGGTAARFRFARLRAVTPEGEELVAPDVAGETPVRPAPRAEDDLFATEPTPPAADPALGLDTAPLVPDRGPAVGGALITGPVPRRRRNDQAAGRLAAERAGDADAADQPVEASDLAAEPAWRWVPDDEVAAALAAVDAHAEDEPTTATPVIDAAPTVPEAVLPEEPVAVAPVEPRAGPAGPGGRSRRHRGPRCRHPPAVRRWRRGRPVGSRGGSASASTPAGAGPIGPTPPPR
ncbi:hypothetical protein KSP35_01600 [Aquihabitans sp. G128]|uniref:hypothetical protein n=1 Tax=Aquihabitans sp. G128 TaxID=2849779 RepID=UPI001C22CB0B|nr:hypothetical protein [Aquihabitans sp. G128]QXC61570.1 hypothetical protein KSP35_01600 [Aquihabitans sp. G128]